MDPETNWYVVITHQQLLIKVGGANVFHSLREWNKLSNVINLFLFHLVTTKKKINGSNNDVCLIGNKIFCGLIKSTACEL